MGAGPAAPVVRGTCWNGTGLSGWKAPAAHAGQRPQAPAAMRPQPGGHAVGEAAAFLLFLLLLLLGVGVCGGTAASMCDCAPDLHRRNSRLCCQGCPAGYYLKAPCTEPCGNSTCLPCPLGTFLARENYRTQCTRCQACDEQASQVALKNCSAVADTHCGCEPGWFPECLFVHCGDSSPFKCSPCLDCGALHRHTRLHCSNTDTVCGTCLPGFYERDDDCVSCPTSTLGSCPEPCTAVCGWRQMFWVQVLLAGLGIPLLLGATLTYTSQRCRCRPRKRMARGGAETEALTPPQAAHHLSPSPSAHNLLVSAGGGGAVCTVQLVGNSFPQSQEGPHSHVAWSWDQLPNQALDPVLEPPPLPAPPAGSPSAVLQPGPQLYDVMDAVPARRWKEFVRTLGLREAEIEAVEVEISRFRDQQYEMLKRWRQQQPAGLGAVYAALERMGLDGCAEDLRSRLQRGA